MAVSAKFPLWDITDDGTVVTVNGGLVRLVELRGVDGMHTDYVPLQAAASELYAWLKADCPEEVFLHFGMMSGSASVPAENFSAVDKDSVLAWQVDGRIEFLNQRALRQNRVVLAYGSMGGLGRGLFPKVSQAQHSERLVALDELQEKIDTLMTRLGLVAWRLKSQEVFSLYSSWLGAASLGGNPTRGNPVLALKAAAERLVPGHVEWDDDHVRVGESFFSVLTLRDFDDTTHFGLADDVLLQLPDYARVSIVAQMPKQQRVLDSVLQGRKFQAAQSGKGEFVKDEAELAKLAEATELYETLIQTGQRLVGVTIQVVVEASSLDGLAERTRRVQNQLRDHRLTFYTELRAHDRELGKTLPGLGAHSKRTQLVTSNNAADIFPVFTECAGDKTPCLLFETSRGYLYNFDPFERSRDNWNGMILGASGSGKSVFTNMLISMAMATRPGRIMIVDFAGETKSSYLMIAKLFGGQFFPVLSDSNDYAINPFPTKAEAWDGAGLKATVSSFLVVLTDLLIANEGASMDSELYRVILTRGLEDTYRVIKDAETAPIYSDLLETLEGYVGLEEVDQGRLETIVKLLRGFLSGPNAKFLNRPSTINPNAPFVIFDLFGIDALPMNVREALVFLVCSYVKNLAFDASDAGRKYVFLDEVAQLIKRDSMKSLLDELYSTARKHNTSVWTITQQYAAYKESALSGVIAINSTSLVLLSHANDVRARDLVSDDLALNGRERELFDSLRTRKGVYSELLIKTQVLDDAGVKKDIASKCRLALSPRDYEICTSDAEDRKIQNTFIEANQTAPLKDVLAFLIEEKEKGSVAR